MAGVARVLNARNHLGETPVWSPAERALWWINCEHPAELHRWSPETGEHDRWPLPARVGGFVPKAGGGLLLALADGLYDFAPDEGVARRRVPSPLPGHLALHECQCDRQGRLWVGALDRRYPADRGAAGGAFFRLDGESLVPIIEGVAVANGLAFSPDGRTMYAASSSWRRVDAFDLDIASGTLSNRRPFLKFGDDERGFIDGATVDAAGGYWLAVVGVGELRRYRPDGALDRVIPLPCSNPTKPAFGGPDMATLYVTSTRLRIGAPAPADFENGGLFALTPGETGIAETPLAPRRTERRDRDIVPAAADGGGGD